MKSFATIMFASGALASLSPAPYYPAAEEYKPSVYPTGAVPTKATYESAPYPYATEKKETVYPYPSEKKESSSTTCETETESATKYYATESKYYSTESASKYYSTESASKYYSTESASKYYSTVTASKPYSTESASTVYVTKTYEHESMKPTDVQTKTIVYTVGVKTYTETKVIVVPTYGADQHGATQTVVVIAKPTPVVYAPKHEAVETKVVTVYVTAPAKPAVCTPVEDKTVTVTQSLTITVPEAKITGYSNKTVIVTPVHATTPVVYQPVNPSYAPVNPSYAPAANGTKDSVPKPTYSAPVQYTGGAATAAAGFGAVAFAFFALAL